MKTKKLSVGEYQKSSVMKFRESWLKKGFDLVDITPHIKLQLGESGWCNEFNEPDEKIYHIRAIYRDEIIANFPEGVIDSEKYVVFLDKDENDLDFIIFRKVPQTLKGEKSSDKNGTTTKPRA